MLRCPSCRSLHPNNSLFCDQCGARLPESSSRGGTSELGSDLLLRQTPIPHTQGAPKPAKLVLLVSGQEQGFDLPLTEKIILGRRDPDRQRAALVDLSP
ncbi:MAG: hypothetical protein GX605_14085, partial [Chloroflexi bacterium]|nr:hypothetical protein [Chloroflexota bacterium]